MKKSISMFFNIVAAVIMIIVLFFATVIMVIGEVICSMWETVRYGDSSYTTRKISAFRGDSRNNIAVKMCGRRM